MEKLGHSVQGEKGDASVPTLLRTTPAPTQYES
jgi:hypothetical protein